MSNYNYNELSAKMSYETLDYEYSTLMTSLHVSVSRHLLDEHFTSIWANDYYYKLIRYPKAEYEALFHNHVDEFYKDYPDDLKHISEVLRNALDKGNPGYECICRMPQKGGTYIWVRLVGTFIHEYVNEYPVVYTVFTDITDLIHMQAEQSITFENLPGFVTKCKITKKNEIELIYGNSRFNKFFQVDFMDNSPVYMEGNVPLIQQCITAIKHQFPAMYRGEEIHFTIPLKDNSGDSFWFQVNAECIDWIGCEPVYLAIWIDITDITEQQEIQRQLEERTDLLRNALQIAEHANHAKSDFLSRMSHDIRTPLNAILGMLTIAEESDGNTARITDCMSKIHTSANFLLSLINDILDMSKIESRKVSLKRGVFDFPSFMQEISTMFTAQAERKQIYFNIEISPGLEDVYIGDKLKINQILNNLLSNAVKFTDAGGSISLTVKPGKCYNHAAELCFIVQDTGQGIDKSFINKLFQPFEQENQAVSNQNGTGLGLTIAASYSKLMNGGIQVESQPGIGSTFTAHIWLEREERDSSSYEQFKNTKILMVDSNTDAYEYFFSIFDKLDVNTFWVPSYSGALDELMDAQDRIMPFSIVIIECSNDAEHCLGLIREIRNSFSKNELIIAVRGYRLEIIREAALRAGADYILQNPLFSSTIYDFLINATYKKHVIQKIPHKRSAFSGEKVLLAEDNELNQEIAVTLLESRGLCIETADNGQEALTMFNCHEAGYYMAVIMDIQMPVMDGLEAVREIRRLPRPDAAVIPIVAMSANAFDEDVEKSLEAGMNGHLAKPIEIEKVCDVLAQYLPNK